MIVLDTHAWLWWISEPARLGRRARREMTRARHIGVPAICCLEVATLAARGRIELDRPTLDWIDDALSEPRMALLALTPAVAVKAAALGDGFHGDPADRLIVATAILESAALVTKDRLIQAHKAVSSIWD